MPVAAPLWDALPIAALIQFPWRLLAVTAVTLSVLAAFAVSGAGADQSVKICAQTAGPREKTAPVAWELCRFPSVLEHDRFPSAFAF